MNGLAKAQLNVSSQLLLERVCTLESTKMIKIIFWIVPGGKCIPRITP